MSVSDPLIRDIKGCVLVFLEEVKLNRTIDDTNTVLFSFCQNIENIFSTGLVATCNTLGFTKQPDAWSWLSKIIQDKEEEIPYSYSNCVENAKLCKNVLTNTGRFRLLVRLCLIRKCLHIPIEYLKSTKKTKEIYQENSIIGDEILSEILLSVLRQCSKIVFRLNPVISSFLDVTWSIPEVLKLEFVPCENLGLTVSFAGDKAIITSIRSNSVVSENGKIEVGDVIDTLNGVVICSRTKGRLHSILKSYKKQPVVLTVIKAVYTEKRQLYGPMVNLLKQVNLDPDVMRQRIAGCETYSEDTSKEKKSVSGFNVIYMGYIEVGSKGDVRQIDKAVSSLLSPTVSLSWKDGRTYGRSKKSVVFEIGELGLKVIEPVSSQVFMKHSYMEISACGSVSALPNYFAYIAGDKYCNLAKKFTCYIFFANNTDVAFTILQSIGQGFQRTHFAV